MACTTCKHVRQAVTGRDCKPCVNAFITNGTEPNWKPKGAIGKVSEERTQVSDTVSLSEDDAERASMPLADGCLDYFPNALAYVAFVSKQGSDKHNPGQEMHWARDKSTDHANKMMRHLIDRGRMDSDGIRHSGYVAWRALANLQNELEEAGLCPPSRASK